MAVAKGKKRYQIPLTSDNVDRFQRLVQELGMPRGTMAAALDDTIRGLCEVFQKAKDSGGFTLNDMFKMIGEQVTEIVEIEKKEVASVPQKKRSPSRNAKNA